MRVQQHAAQSTTVRDIVRKARGRNPEAQKLMDQSAAFFGHFPKNIDLQDCLNHINQANEMFERFDPLVRARFGNQPSQLIKFLQDEGNYNEAVKFGLIPVEKQIEREKAVKAKKAAEKAAKQAEIKEVLGNSQQQQNA